MTKFEKSCEEFRKKHGYLTPKQQAALNKIRENNRRKGKIRSFYQPDRQLDADFASAFDWGSQ